MARQNGKDRGLFQRGGVWWVRWTCPYGHEHREKIGTSKTLARHVYQERKVAVKTERFCLTRERDRRRWEQPILFSDVAKRYLDWSKEHRPRSHAMRVSALGRLKESFGTDQLKDISRQDVEAHQKRRLDSGAKPGTVNRERSVLSHLFTVAQRWELATHNPVAGTERLKEHNEHPRPITVDEQRRLFDVLPESYHGFVILALHTGLRLNELRTQLWRDIDLAAGTLTVTQPKSGKRESIPLNSVAFSILAQLPQDGPLLFPGMPKRLSESFALYVRKAGLKDITFHCLRDTYISRLAPHCNTPTLMALARHRKYETTRRYVSIDGDHLRQAVEALTAQNCAATGTRTGTEF